MNNILHRTCIHGIHILEFGENINVFFIKNGSSLTKLLCSYIPFYVSTNVVRNRNTNMCNHILKYFSRIIFIFKL